MKKERNKVLTYVDYSGPEKAILAFQQHLHFANWKESPEDINGEIKSEFFAFERFIPTPPDLPATERDNARKGAWGVKEEAFDTHECESEQCPHAFVLTTFDSAPIRAFQMISAKFKSLTFYVSHFGLDGSAGTLMLKNGEKPIGIECGDVDSEFSILRFVPEHVVMDYVPKKILSIHQHWRWGIQALGIIAGWFEKTIDSTQSIRPALESSGSPSSEETETSIETGSLDRGCSDVCDICGGFRRMEARLENLNAPTALVRELAKLKTPLCSTRDQIYMSLDSLEEFQQQLEAHVNQRWQSDTCADVIDAAAQAITNWQDIVDDLVSATDDLLMKTSSLDEHMKILESAHRNSIR